MSFENRSRLAENADGDLYVGAVDDEGFVLFWRLGCTITSYDTLINLLRTVGEQGRWGLRTNSPDQNHSGGLTMVAIYKSSKLTILFENMSDKFKATLGV